VPGGAWSGIPLNEASHFSPFSADPHDPFPGYSPTLPPWPKSIASAGGPGRKNVELVDIIRCAMALLGMLALNFTEPEETPFFH